MAHVSARLLCTVLEVIEPLLQLLPRADLGSLRACSRGVRDAVNIRLLRLSGRMAWETPVAQAGHKSAAAFLRFANSLVSCNQIFLQLDVANTREEGEQCGLAVGLQDAEQLRGRLRRLSVLVVHNFRPLEDLLPLPITLCHELTSLSFTGRAYSADIRADLAHIAQLQKLTHLYVPGPLSHVLPGLLATDLKGHLTSLGVTRQLEHRQGFQLNALTELAALTCLYLDSTPAWSCVTATWPALGAIVLHAPPSLSKIELQSFTSPHYTFDLEANVLQCIRAGTGAVVGDVDLCELVSVFAPQVPSISISSLRVRRQTLTPEQ